MSMQRWLGLFWQRVLFFLLAGLITIALLHVEEGLVPAIGGGPDSFSVAEWLHSVQIYLRRVLHGEWGEVEPLKVTGYMQPIPVLALLRSHGPASGLLLALALLLSLSFGTLAGLLTSRFGARRFRGSALASTLLLLSTPDILIVLLLRALVVWFLSTFGLKLFSLMAFSAELAPGHFIAPVLALTALPLALVARVSAVAFDEVHDQLYIRTARAKGVSPLRLITRHAMKNAWIRVAESGPLIMSTLVTGLVVVEYILYFPGLGRTLGLILEKGGQPVASSGTALVLLLGAVLIESLFAILRMRLDPRLTQPRASEGRTSLDDLLASLLAGLREAPRALAEWRAELPAKLRRLPWRWRPSRIAAELRQNRPLLIGGTGVAVLVVLAILGGQLADLVSAHTTPRYVIQGGEVFIPPFPPGLLQYPLGSDMMGRSVLARLLAGVRYTLFFTLAVTPVRFLFALPWGLLAGLRGGPWAAAGRTLSLVVSALPVILIPVALLPLQRTLPNASDASRFWLITLILALVGIPRLVEAVRQNVEAIAVLPFVEGARAAGAREGRILGRHILPHLAPQLWVIAATDAAWTLLLLAQFGVFSIFLGGAVASARAFTDSSYALLPRLPDWSSMLSKPYEVIYRAPWSLWFPALAFLLAIVAFNLVAEGLRRRAQRMESGLAAEEEESPEAQRRLFLEWRAVGLFLLVVGLPALMIGFGKQFKGASEPPEARALREFQATAGLITGTASDREKSRALKRLPQVTMRYLEVAHAARLSNSKIQVETGSLLTLHENGNQTYRLADLYVSQSPEGPVAFLFLQRLSDGQTSYVRTVERPVTFTVLESGSHHSLLVAGTVPQPPHSWVVSVFVRPAEAKNGALWKPAVADAQGMAARLPGYFRARLIDSRVEQTVNPLANTRVSGSGMVTFCLPNNEKCVDLPWKGQGK